jgi:prepilin-type N-terminal cleavage/methylation domain-containing protein
MGMKRLNSQAGFTLIELVIVIVVLGILGAVAMIQFGTVTQDAKDSALKGLAGAYAGQLAIAVNTVKGLPLTGGTGGGVCTTTRTFGDCVYGMVPNPTSTGITRSTYTVGSNEFVICSDTDATACTWAAAPTGAGGCGSVAERFVRVTYAPATGAVTIAAPAFCAS